MTVIGIIANGPVQYVPDLKQYESKIDLWIGVDRGTLKLIENNIKIDYAVGDFDSINDKQKAIISQYVKTLDEYPSKKNETDLEIAIQKAFELRPRKIFLFGVTGGRIDHTIINIQLLETILERNIRGIIVDKWNYVELTKRGTHSIIKNEQFPYISFIPYTDNVEGITLSGFYYPLNDYRLQKGSTRCISNALNSSKGTLSYKKGKLLIVQSTDAT